MIDRLAPPLRCLPSKAVWTLVSILFLSGCATAPLAMFSGEPSISLREEPVHLETPAFTGKQQASLKLTDRGRVLLDAGQIDQSISVLQKAVSIHPHNPYAYYFLAKARFLGENYPQTLPLLGKSELYLGHDSLWLSWVYVLRGKTYEALFRFEEAMLQYEEALSFEPRNLKAWEGSERLQGKDLSGSPL